MRSVAICVGHLGVRHRVVAREGPALKFGVGSVDARVNDVGPGALAGTALVDVLTVAGLAVRDRSKAPGGCGLGDLGGVDRDGPDGLDGKDLSGLIRIPGWNASHVDWDVESRIGER